MGKHCGFSVYFIRAIAHHYPRFRNMSMGYSLSLPEFGLTTLPESSPHLPTKHFESALLHRIYTLDPHSVLILQKWPYS